MWVLISEDVAISTGKFIVFNRLFVLIGLDAILNLARMKARLWGTDLQRHALDKGHILCHFYNNLQNCFMEVFFFGKTFSWIIGMLLNYSTIHWTHCTSVSQASFSFFSKNLNMALPWLKPITCLNYMAKISFIYSISLYVQKYFWPLP